VEALQGRVPGMDITRASGVPGAGTNVVIRGNKSITIKDKMVARNSPLYVVDGYQLPQGTDIADINPNDIESIDVLKDASSTAIYGALGANGVVIVTTKKGGEGKVNVSYNSFYGVNYYKYPDSRIGNDYLNLRREAWRTANEWESPDDDATIFPDAGEWDAVQNGQWVDWVDLVKRNGRQHSHTLSINGGSEKTKVFTSFGYFREDGMLKDNDYSRYNVRLNLDQTLNKWIKTGILSQVTYGITNNRKDPLSQATSISPLGVPYDENGVVNTYPVEFDQTKMSPLADEKNDNIARDNTIRTNILANGYLELTPLKGLSFRSNVGINLTFSRRGIYFDKESLSRANTKTTLTSSESVFGRFLTWDNILAYTRDLNKHSFTVTALTSYLQSDTDRTLATGANQIVASQLFYGLNGTVPTSVGAPYVGWKNMAYAGRFNYSYDGKYLLTVSGRYDGASRLAPGHKWAFFPSVAVGWNISDEIFMSSLRAVNLLKLRASYGISGNYAIDEYGTQSGLYPGRNMSFGDVSAPMYQFNPLIGNPDLGWETSATVDLGLDFAVLENRINASVDLYKTTTSDILMQRSLPQSSGVGSVYQNIAETENKGIEISVTSQNIRNKNFQWSTTFTFAKNEEEITALIDGRDIIKNERESLLLGRPINSFYTFNKQGIWQTEEADNAASYKANSATGNPFQPGDIKVKDLNGDFIISADSDRMHVGSAVPKGVIGLQNNFSFRGFDLGIFIFARYGQTIDAEFLGRYNPSGNGNGPASLNYWTPENPTNDYPRPRKDASLSTYTGYTGYQALNFVDGSFVKIRNITLGYTLPSTLTERVSIRRARVYFTGNNLFLKTRSHLINDYDPERGGSESSPLSRTLVVGLNVDF
jgi:TonB-linked SusC/RagA family outer membrane protein